jgi:hypothetical protein
MTIAEVQHAFSENMNTLDMGAYSLKKSPSGKPWVVQ